MNAKHEVHCITKDCARTNYDNYGPQLNSYHNEQRGNVNFYHSIKHFAFTSYKAFQEIER